MRTIAATHDGAIISNGNLYCPVTPRSLLELGPIDPHATPKQAPAPDAKTPETARYKLGRITRDDEDGYHRVQCPAAIGKIRCPLRPPSMRLDRDRPEILTRPEPHARRPRPPQNPRRTPPPPPRGPAAPPPAAPAPNAASPPPRTPPPTTSAAAGAASWAWHPSCCSPPPCSSSATSGSSPPGTPGNKTTPAAPPPGSPRKPAGAAARPSPASPQRRHSPAHAHEPRAPRSPPGSASMPANRHPGQKATSQAHIAPGTAGTRARNPDPPGMSDPNVNIGPTET